MGIQRLVLGDRELVKEVKRYFGAQRRILGGRKLCRNAKLFREDESQRRRHGAEGAKVRGRGE